MQAIGNLFFSNWLEHPEEHVFGERADTYCKALVKEAHAVISTSLGVTNINPMWTYRVCDATVVHNGISSEREIFVYREGFYRGASFSFGLLTLGLLVRSIVGNTSIVWNANEFAVPRSLLVALVANSALATGLMITRYHRFAQHRVKHALIGFLLIHKLRRKRQRMLDIKVWNVSLSLPGHELLRFASRADRTASNETFANDLARHWIYRLTLKICDLWEAPLIHTTCPVPRGQRAALSRLLRARPKPGERI